jgi:hypothetical protein
VGWGITIFVAVGGDTWVKVGIFTGVNVAVGAISAMGEDVAFMSLVPTGTQLERVKHSRAWIMMVRKRTMVFIILTYQFVGCVRF